ncbi:hypothetical protein J7L60_06540 [Candidatus Bathyarchaeota archaeon]|nr:hypothetical protein [Candidatus Bathyarchaeota archaeon]
MRALPSSFTTVPFPELGPQFLILLQQRIQEFREFEDGFVDIRGIMVVLSAQESFLMPKRSSLTSRARESPFSMREATIPITSQTDILLYTSLTTEPKVDAKE